VSESDPTASPHASRQGYRRQESAALRMTIGAKLAMSRYRSEIHPVPERRQFAAPDRLRIFAIQRGRHLHYLGGADMIVQRLGSADPLAQVIDRQRFSHACSS
jgi:hypothetical protein